MIYEEILPVHVSGHGSQEDIKLLIQLTKPKYFIPAYGEMRHLKQASIIAQQTGIPKKRVFEVENGQIINVKNGKVKLNGTIPIDTILVDGSWVGDLGPDELRDRTLLSRDGIVLVHINLDKNTKKIYGSPEITSRGFAASQDAENILSHLTTNVAKAVNTSNGNLERNVVNMVRNHVYKETKRNPTVLVTTSEI